MWLINVLLSYFCPNLLFSRFLVLFRLHTKTLLTWLAQELESLDTAKLENLYIQHPVQLEQHLMEGAYNKLLLAKENVPAESYSFFMNILIETVR